MPTHTRAVHRDGWEGNIEDIYNYGHETLVDITVPIEELSDKYINRQDTYFKLRSTLIVGEGPVPAHVWKDELANKITVSVPINSLDALL